ncbi:ABC transporter ATP-binding protein [Schaalia sp. 19OD2882]|uniref:ABC transporter ATP-binding protein n=1 Tax=Schaalia sp. 19OD2882 TaxID=2794089 RepID=UPI001C1EFD64|nr:ABC transporter ATP-binding protein [Schaalia sp. 19OD2882]QWW19355.1 ABC transporter ATP-binding protein [Schaalia sp. 19OD2882]
MTSSEVLLRLEGVGHVHGRGPTQVRALSGVDLTLRAGELLAVMGPSGSGKSTLLHVAGSLEIPTEGRVWLGGEDVTAMSEHDRARVRRRSVGYVFQEANLLPGLSTAENVALPLELDGTPSAEAMEAALSALEAVGIGDLCHRFPDELSGGQAQRAAIARALVGQRSLLLADEPTGALDLAGGDQVMVLMRDHVDAGAAGLLVTHEARFAAWADRTLFLRDGRIIDCTGADDVRALLGE